MQTFGIILVLSMGSTTFSLQLVLFCIGAWWLLFTIPAAIWLRPRPGPPLPKLNANGSVATMNGSYLGTGERGLLSYIAYAWRGLWNTMLRARRLKDVMLFLAAWFMISDGVATVSGTAILFAKTVSTAISDNLCVFIC